MKNFPEGVPKPSGPINMVPKGSVYDALRDAANKINTKLNRAFGLGSADIEVHEINPVKFGGSPTDLANKVALRDTLHSKATSWFRKLQGLIEKDN